MNERLGLPLERPDPRPLEHSTTTTDIKTSGHDEPGKNTLDGSSKDPVFDCRSRDVPTSDKGLVSQKTSIESRYVAS